MAILFDFYHSPSPKSAEGEKTEKFHARVTGSQTLNVDEIVRHISQRSTLSKGDILAVIGELSDEIADGLLRGDQVNIPGIGNFFLSLKAPKDANPQKTNAQNIEVKRVEFRADFQLSQKVKDNAIFERSKEKVHSASINQLEMETLLSEYFKDHPFITRKVFEEYFHLTRSTASRHLKRLVHEGKIKNTNTPQHPVFVPVHSHSLP